MTLDPGKYWSTLKINKSGDSGWTKVEFLDQIGSPISGFDYDDSETMFDIRPLNDLGIRGFALRTTMNATIDELLELHGWSYEWNSSNSYYDGFNTDLFINLPSNALNLENGWISLRDGEDLGKFMTGRISIGPNNYWDEILISGTVPSPSVLYVDVYDPNSGIPIKGYSHLVGNRIDISGIDAIRYREISLNFRFERWGSGSPMVDSISVTWIPNTDIMIRSLDTPSIIYRGEEYIMELDIIDFEQPIHTLDVVMEARRMGSDIWEDDLIGDIGYNSSSNKLDVPLTPFFTTVVGVYEFKCTITDNQNNVYQYVFPDNVTVMNNIPLPPQIEIRPEMPKTQDTLSAVMVAEGSDIETSSLTYNYRWYLNDEHLPLYDSDDIQPFTDPIIDPFETRKGDTVSVRVYSFDGLDLSDPTYVSINIQNTPPRIKEEFEGILTLFEDPENETIMDYNDICNDVDNDPLSFSVSDAVNVSVEPDDERGHLIIIPDDNWFGYETVTLTISDGLDLIETHLGIEVLSVNDLPTGSIILPESDMEIEVGGKVTFSAEAEDVETRSEDLVFRWMIGDDEISSEKFFDHFFRETGSFNVTCQVSDGDDTVFIGSRLVEVADKTPDYLKSDFHREHADNGKAILYDIVDFKGNVEDVREDPGSELDIISISSELKGENVKITMELAIAPSDSSFTGVQKINYRIYFVSPDWSEPVFDSTKMGPDTVDSVIPQINEYYNVGTYGSLGYLTYGMGNLDYGDPVVDGNSIIWTVPAIMIVNSNMELEDYDIYGVSLMESDTSMIITKGFDTIGKGSSPHQITGQPKTSIEDDNGNSDNLLQVFLVGAIILLLVFIILLVVFIFMIMKKNRKESGPEPVQSPDTGTDPEAPVFEGRTEEPQAPQMTPSVSGIQPPDQQVLPSPDQQQQDQVRYGDQP